MNRKYKKAIKTIAKLSYTYQVRNACIERLYNPNGYKCINRKLITELELSLELLAEKKQIIKRENNISEQIFKKATKKVNIKY
jgi:hypothetical protein